MTRARVTLKLGSLVTDTIIEAACGADVERWVAQQDLPTQALWKRVKVSWEPVREVVVAGKEKASVRG